MDIPNTGAVFTLGKSHLAENTQSYFYIKNDPVKRLISGPNQSAVICESGRLFVWGENHYGQLGVGSHSHNNNDTNKNNININNGDIITKPTCVKSLKTLGLKIADIAFGNDWAVILTHSNELFFTGRNIFADETNVARNFTEATVEDEQCFIIRKPFRLEEFDDCLSKSEEAENFVTVLAGNEHFVAITSFGRLIGWGSNRNNQLGTSAKVTSLQPHEIKLDALIQQFVCGPESTLVLTENGNLFLTGHLNDFAFSQFTELQKNLSATEQIIFMHISKTNEIYIVTNAGSIYRSIESVRNKSLIFQRFYDYDSEENGPIWKLLKGLSFYTVLTKANKFYTTFSESGHHLKTFREISKFKNLRLLDMAVGDQHILVHGIPRSSTLSATVGPGGEHRFMSRSYVMNALEGNGASGGDSNGNSGRSRSGGRQVRNENITEEGEAEDVNGNEAGRGERKETPKPNTPIHESGEVTGEADGVDLNAENFIEAKRVEVNGNLKENIPRDKAKENGITEENEGGILTTPTPSGVKSPTESIKSRKSVRSIKFEHAILEKISSSDKLLRPRTPYPESSSTSTPQTIKKTPLRNYSYEAAMDQDYIEHTSPALVDSLENIPESVAGEKAAAITISTPTPPVEEDEQLTVEINTTTDALDRTILVNEIRFINNGVDVTANVKEKMPETDDGSIEDSLDENVEDMGKQAESDLDKIEYEIEEHVDKVKNFKNEMQTDAREAVGDASDKVKESTEKLSDKMKTATEKVGDKMKETTEKVSDAVETKLHEARESVETAAKTAATGTRDAVDAVGENAKRMVSDARQAVENVGSNAMKAAGGARQAVENVGSNTLKAAGGAKQAMGNALSRVADDTKHAVGAVTSKISNEMQEAKENFTSLLQGRPATKEAIEDGDNESTTSEAASKEGGAKTNTTTGEDDERTTASVNSNQTSAGNPFEGSNPFENNANPFENELDDVVERGKRALAHDLQAAENRADEEADKSKGRVRQFFSDMRAKGKGLSCRNEKSIRIDDEPPRYSVEDEFVQQNQIAVAGASQNTSRVCSIL